MKQLNLNHRTRLTKNARFWRTVIKGKEKKREREGIRMVSHRHSPQEIGNFHGHTAASGRNLRKFAKTGPLGCIIDIQIQRKPMVKTMNQAAVHHIVHLVGHTLLVPLRPQLRRG